MESYISSIPPAKINNLNSHPGKVEKEEYIMSETSRRKKIYTKHKPTKLKTGQ